MVVSANGSPTRNWGEFLIVSEILSQLHRSLIFHLSTALLVIEIIHISGQAKVSERIFTAPGSINPLSFAYDGRDVRVPIKCVVYCFLDMT